jgi:catechol 1,2-dioxygenase
MIVENQKQVTEAVLHELQRIKDPRTREIISAAVRHLHDFAREVKLTEDEFRQACAFIAELGKRTTETHNEVVLLAGSLGFSTLVCLLNNGNSGQTETTANLLGPFWRLNSPPTENGGSIVRSATPGPALFVTAWVRDNTGKPVADAEVDVWQSSPEGFYENQDPVQADMNLRGKFRTDENGGIRFRSVRPSGYPIPVNGPVGDFIRLQGRHNMRPAHVHFLIYKPGYKTHISQVYVNDDPNLETDVQFGVTRALVGNYVHHENEPAPDPDVTGPWYSLEFTFTIESGDAKLPRAPITGKAEGKRVQLEILKRT